MCNYVSCEMKSTKGQIAPSGADSMTRRTECQILAKLSQNKLFFCLVIDFCAFVPETVFSGFQRLEAPAAGAERREGTRGSEPHAVAHCGLFAFCRASAAFRPLSDLFPLLISMFSVDVVRQQYHENTKQWLKYRAWTHFPDWNHYHSSFKGKAENTLATQINK